MRSALVAVLLVATSATFGACDCSGGKEPGKGSAAVEDPQAAPERTGGPASARTRDRPQRSPTPTGPVRQSLPLTVEDASAALPKFDARSIAEPMVSPSGSSVRFTYCFDSGDLTAAAASAEATLEAAGWTDIVSKAPDGATSFPRHGIAAQKGDLRVSLAAQAVRRGGCDETVGGILVSASLHRLADLTPP